MVISFKSAKTLRSGFTHAIPALTMILSLASCDDSFSEDSAIQVDVKVELPADVDAVSVIEPVISFKNISSGNVIEFSGSKESFSIFPGLYDVEYSASSVSSSGNILSIKGVVRSVNITSPDLLIRIPTFCGIASDDLLICEIFFAGTLQDSGNQYLGDDYIKLYNNTDHTVYADGITIFESGFLTTEKFDYSPDIMDAGVTVQAIYTVPGSGKEHPVSPGEFLLLADVGIDHRTVNPNSFSLAHADWEWYDESSSPGNLDIDSSVVPNLDKWYCYTKSFWMLHNRGFRAYGIARIPIPKEEFLEEYRYSYDYEIVTVAGTFPMSRSAYWIPNEWIVDAVNCSVQSEWVWNVTAPSIDMGWTFCGTIDNDKKRFFHSVRRKLLYVDENGIPVLRDTNNSSLDFNSHVVPSEIELQHSSLGIGQGNSRTITYDGITSINM